MPIVWSVTLWDWSKGVTTEKIMRKAERQIRGGDVILLHDGCFEFVTVPEMIEATGFQVP